MGGLKRGGTAEPVSRDQIKFQARVGTCSADHEQDWQPYPVDNTLLYVCCILEE